MTLLVPNSSEEKIFRMFLNMSTPEDLVLRLFSNDKTPVETDTISDYTEVTGGGYASQPLVSLSWVIVQGDPTQASQPEIIFTFTGSVGNVYGYYVNQTTSTDLIWAERFTNGPFNIQHNNDEIRVTLTITLE